jgi:hypothetical protein
MQKITINIIKVSILALFAVTTMPVQAYIGPGMGGGAIAVVFGILAAIFMAIFGFIYYPVKRWLKRRKIKNS